MKAMIYNDYGNPDVLQLAEIKNPVPSEDEILVKIHATTVTTADVRLRSLNVPTGFGIMVRLFQGLTKPRKQLLGSDFAGIVTEIGSNVKDFQIGDRVFGSSKSGTYAEYTVIKEKNCISRIPDNLSFEQAAALPFGAMTSLTFIRDIGKLEKGQTILINGASGSLGTNAIQLAKYYGAKITAVCSDKNIDLVKSLGADEAIDYNKEDFKKSGKKYDIIYDTLGLISPKESLEMLNESGQHLMAVATVPQYLDIFKLSLMQKKKINAGMAIFDKKNIEAVAKLAKQGILNPIIDKSFSLEEIAEAHRFVDKGHKVGSVVIMIEKD